MSWGGAALERNGPAVLAPLVGFAWFAAHVGAGVVNPTRVEWLLNGDWALSYFGWAFFRLAPLQLPLGANPDFPHGVGSSLAYTDSIPLVGVLLRPLSAVLPAHFQYLGPWLALCFALQGFVGAKLVRIVTTDAAAQVLGGALFTLAPPLLHRVLGPDTGHASLCAHWLVLSFLWLALARVDPGGVGRRIGVTAALLFFAAGVHPYLLAMGAVMAAALVARLRLVDHAIGWRRAFAAAGVLAASMAVGLSGFGYLSGGVATEAPGFGYYSADALALVNPMGWSRLWPGITVGVGQYEGFAYLGAGVLALAVAAAVAAIRWRERIAASRWRAALPVLAAAMLLAIFALSDVVTVGGYRGHVSAYEWLPAVRMFRATGRFVWPLHYVVVFAAIAALAVAFRTRPRVLAAAIGGAALLQIADVRPPVPMPPPDTRWLPPAGAWASARGTYRHVSLVPPLLRTGAGEVTRECPISFQPDDYVPIAELAYGISATFNSGHFARLDPERAGSACARLQAALAAGRLEPDTIYVTHPAYRALLRGAGASCGEVDGMPACVQGGLSDPFASAIREHPLE